MKHIKIFENFLNGNIQLRDTVFDKNDLIKYMKTLGTKSISIVYVDEDSEPTANEIGLDDGDITMVASNEVGTKPGIEEDLRGKIIDVAWLISILPNKVLFMYGEDGDIIMSPVS